MPASHSCQAAGHQAQRVPDASPPSGHHCWGQTRAGKEALWEPVKRPGPRPTGCLGETGFQAAERRGERQPRPEVLPRAATPAET